MKKFVEEKARWNALYHELKSPMAAPDSDFIPLDAAEILAEAKRRKRANWFATDDRDQQSHLP